VGAEPDRLTLKEQVALAGKWIALEIYTRETQPSRRIAAVGDSATDCIRQLIAKGLDSEKFEFRPMKRPI
jgi:hypothetical protein